MLAKVKQFIKSYQADIILAVGVMLISLLSFALGYIVGTTYEKEPIRFENTKHEIRSTKQITIIKIQNPKHVWNLDIRI